MGYAARAHAHHADYRTLPLPLLILLAIGRRLCAVIRRGGGSKSLQPGRPETGPAVPSRTVSE